MAPLNGTLRKSIIAGLVGLGFTGLAALGANHERRTTRMEDRQDHYDAEQFRIGKVAAGRGKELTELHEARKDHESRLRYLEALARGGRGWPRNRDWP